MERPRYLPIGDYGIIGDLHTTALIGRQGSIDWMCIPRFDSPSVFGRLLDADSGGAMWVEVEDGFIPDSRRYLPGTNILETTLSSPHGRLRITDFMVAREQEQTLEHDHILVRLLEAPDSQLNASVHVDARFDYGATDPDSRVDGIAGSCLALEHGEVHMHIDGPGGWHREERAMVQRLSLRRGEPQAVILSYDGQRTYDHGQDPLQLLQDTREYWERWIGRCNYDGPYLDMVLRSALTLKLLIYAPEGSIVAAPTTSLPEWIGGGRNWDYRFTWLRDSSFLVYALQLLGYAQESAAFMGWLGRVHRQHPRQWQTMYGIDGRTDLPEVELSHLEGYQGSKPVRIGNGAADQLQLDIYGETLDSVYLHLRFGKIEAPGVRAGLVDMLRHVAESWEKPDNGIWEVRGGARHFLYSKLLCWVALDRGLRLADELKLPIPRQQELIWTREQIRHTILTRGWSDKLGSFRQALDEDALDATALMIPLLNFLPPMDPRVCSTVEAIRRDLTDESGFVYRYRRDDGLGTSEGTFLLCSFWLVNNLALQRQLGPARDLFERLIAHGNDLGLFSEELDPRSGELLGNFPQAFTHLAIINAAAHIERAAENRGPLDPVH
ncbi:MAG TPA: glycoside hydrolase family 15 protein [Candidatus Dormibacteraeota bacterium]|nr:glycoside hydrolase family 15 protein [Candidatus Dormibacteraeota bacterium]